MERIINEAVYKTAMERIGELLPMVTDDTPLYDRKAIELKIMSDIVIEYEECHFPIANSTLADDRMEVSTAAILDAEIDVNR